MHHPEHAGAPRADAVIEAYGQSCGVLEPRLAAQMRRMRRGEVLEVRSDRLEAREGIASWCWLTGNELLSVVEEDTLRSRIFLRRK